MATSGFPVQEVSIYLLWTIALGLRYRQRAIGGNKRPSRGRRNERPKRYLSYASGVVGGVIPLRHWRITKMSALGNKEGGSGGSPLLLLL